MWMEDKTFPDTEGQCADAVTTRLLVVGWKPTDALCVLWEIP